MRRFNLAVLVFVAVSGMTARTHGESFYESIQRSVVYVKIPKPVYENVNGTLHEVWLRNPSNGNSVRKMVECSGTGFLIYHSNATYVVTAKHIAVDDAGRTSPLGEIWVNVTGQNAVGLSIAEMCKKREWFLHPNADIAVLPYCRPANLPVEALDTPENFIGTNRVSIMSPVFAVGFPMGLGVGLTLEPVAKKCEVSAPTIRIDANTNTIPCILLDQALAQGYSGSPLYGLKFVIDYRAGVFYIARCPCRINAGRTAMQQEDSRWTTATRWRYRATVSEGSRTTPT